MLIHSVIVANWGFISEQDRVNALLALKTKNKQIIIWYNVKKCDPGRVCDLGVVKGVVSEDTGLS